MAHTHRRVACLVVCTGAAVLLGAAADAASARTMKSKLAQPVTLNFADAPIERIVIYLQNVARTNFVLDLDAGAHARATINVGRAPLSTVLGPLLRQAGLAYVVEKHAIYVATPKRLRSAKKIKPPRARDKALRKALEKPVTLNFAATPLQSVTTYLAQSADINIVVEATGEQSRVTLKVGEMPLGECLMYLARVSRTRVKCRGNTVVFSGGK